MRFGRSTCRVAPTKKSRKKEPMIGCVFGSSGPERYSAPAGRRVSGAWYEMEEERKRVADGRDVARYASENIQILGGQSHGQHHQRDDRQDVRVAEATVLEDAQTGDAREHGPANERLP